MEKKHKKPKVKVKTKVVKSKNGHQVRLTIGHQSFDLQEQLKEEGMTSYRYAKWYKTCLDISLDELKRSYE